MNILSILNKTFAIIQSNINSNDVTTSSTTTYQPTLSPTSTVIQTPTISSIFDQPENQPNNLDYVPTVAQNKLNSFSQSPIDFPTSNPTSILTQSPTDPPFSSPVENEVTSESFTSAPVTSSIDFITPVSTSSFDSSNKCFCTTQTKELTQDDFSIAKELYFRNRTDFEEKYGEIECWNTAKVEDMTGMFNSRKYFNADISCWDTSSVTDMSSMFWDARAFNIDISNWDVSNVAVMTYLFYNASSFNQDLNTWDVSKSKSFHFMFYYASSFDQRLCWDVAGAASLANDMFYNSNGCLNNDAQCCPTCNPEGNYPYCD